MPGERQPRGLLLGQPHLSLATMGVETCTPSYGMPDSEAVGHPRAHASTSPGVPPQGDDRAVAPLHVAHGRAPTAGGSNDRPFSRAMPARQGPRRQGPAVPQLSAPSKMLRLGTGTLMLSGAGAPTTRNGASHECLRLTKAEPPVLAKCSVPGPPCLTEGPRRGLVSPDHMDNQKEKAWYI